jgi:hypothetical protein
MVTGVIENGAAAPETPPAQDLIGTPDEKDRWWRIPLSHNRTLNRMTLPDPAVVETPKVSGEWTVGKVLDAVGSDKPDEGSNSPLPYFHLLERLKTTKREGWRRFGINRYGFFSSSSFFLMTQNSTAAFLFSPEPRNKALFMTDHASVSSYTEASPSRTTCTGWP